MASGSARSRQNVALIELRQPRSPHGLAVRLASRVMLRSDCSTDLSPVDYVLVKSQGAHAWHLVGQFEAFVGSQRDIWIGSDGSGAIRESSGPVSFFTDEGLARWEAAASPELARGPVVEFYGPGELSDRTRALPSNPEKLAAALTAGPRPTLKAAYHLLGETLASADFTSSSTSRRQRCSATSGSSLIPLTDMRRSERWCPGRRTSIAAFSTRFPRSLGNRQLGQLLWRWLAAPMIEIQHSRSGGRDRPTERGGARLRCAPCRQRDRRLCRQ